MNVNSCTDDCSSQASQTSLAVAIAFASIQAYLADDKRPTLSTPAILAILEQATPAGSSWHGDYQRLLNSNAGAFVSLHLKRDDSLRGCIGTIIGTKENTLAEIVYNAISAAAEDPRFLPVQPDELSQLVVNVDVLSEAEVVAKMNSLAQVSELAVPEILDASHYGVIVSRERQRGLLLPALDGVNTPTEQVAIALRKAGISPAQSFLLERFEVVRYT
jgi:AmmeMemoRadiSam system protein A